MDKDLILCVRSEVRTPVMVSGELYDEEEFGITQTSDEFIQCKVFWSDLNLSTL
jgi:hypothetical protein